MASSAHAEEAQASDPHRLRHALGRFATGVTLVTAADPSGAPVGLTVNSFASLSLEPPLVLWSLREASPTLSAFRAAPRFAVNVLAESQIELSRVFASRHAHRFAAGAWQCGDDGVPLLVGAAATFLCATVSQQQAGDHVLFIGRVLHFADSHEPPLLFQGGRYRRLGTVL
ncbi:MAG: nitrilotriacetate monooxygenase [Rubrivivax sp. SCN 71-131]|nr:MAG: nitrilotriacetate monooxygenase [Rubrivivax sp. SCN 71-131]